MSSTLRRAREDAGRVPVSVVIPTLNEERYLPGLLVSLMREPVQALDIIVVDGQSDDATSAIVERLRDHADPRVAVRLLVTPVRNVSTQRNLGAAAARHDTVVFLDADVRIGAPGQLGALVARFRSGHLAAATCRFRPIERDARAELYFALLYVFHRFVERWDPYAMGACIVTSRDVFRYCGGFDPRLRMNEDANFCRKAACLGRFRVLPVALRVSARRFRRDGYWRMGMRYLRIYLTRRLRGEDYRGRFSYEDGRRA